MKTFVIISSILISFVYNLSCQTITYDNKYTYDAGNDLIITKSGEIYFFWKIQEIIFKDSMVWFSFYNKNNMIVSSFLKNNELEKIVVSIYNNPIIKDVNPAKIQYLILDTAIFKNVYINFEKSPSYAAYSKLLIPNEKFYGFCALTTSLSAALLILNGYYLVPIIAIEPVLMLMYVINNNFTSRKIYNRYLESHQSKLISLRDKIKKQNE